MNGEYLKQARDAGGVRHFLSGRPVHCGDVLEAKSIGGGWIAGRYEASFDHEGDAIQATLIFRIFAGGGTAAVVRAEDLLLRWPDR